jgi:hypothetical protein
MVDEWEADSTKPNPYEEPEDSKSSLEFFPHDLIYILFEATTMQTIRLELTKEEAAEAAAGKVSLHKVLLTKFLSTGFELEDQQ